MAKSLIEIEDEAHKMVEALEVVFTLSHPMMLTFGFTEAEVNEVFIRSARKFHNRHDGQRGRNA